MQRWLCRRSKSLTALFLIGVVGNLGCVSNRGLALNSQLPEGVAHGDDLPILGELSQSQTRIAKPLRIVIYDYPSLSQFPLLELDVDFDSQMVLLAAMGPASSRSCRIEIESVWMGDRKIEVDVTEIYPDSDDQKSPAIVSPIHAVVVPRSELPVSGFTSRIPKNLYLQ